MGTICDCAIALLSWRACDAALTGLGAKGVGLRICQQTRKTVPLDWWGGFNLLAPDLRTAGEILMFVRVRDHRHPRLLLLPVPYTGSSFCQIVLMGIVVKFRIMLPMLSQLLARSGIRNLHGGRPPYPCPSLHPIDFDRNYALGQIIPDVVTSMATCPKCLRYIAFFMNIQHPDYSPVTATSGTLRGDLEEYCAC